MTQLSSSKREITVGQLAARSGVTVFALHFYQAQGLISAGRTTGNQRRYWTPCPTAGRLPPGTGSACPRPGAVTWTPGSASWRICGTG